MTVSTQDTPNLKNDISQTVDSTAQRVLVLLMGDCCPARRWKSGEKKLLQDLATITSLQTMVMNSLPLTDNIRYELAAAAIDVDADVAVRLVRQKLHFRADILSWNRSGKAVLYQLRFERSKLQSPAALSTAILQIVEATLAGLVEVPPKKKKETPPPRLTTTKEKMSQTTGPDSHRHLEVGMNGAAIFSPGDMGTFLAPDMTLIIHPKSWLMFQINGTYATLGKRVTSGSLSADVYFAIIRGLALLSFSVADRFHIGVGLGAGVCSAWTQQVDGDTESKKYVTWLGSQLRLAVSITPYFSLVSQGRLGGLLPEATVRFDHVPAATMGKPLLEWSLGVAFLFL